ncbi:hypothetical protein [Pseudobacter ginsenosidimutans]|uniref:DUF4397 domain-containing protein n=1 Tax=Pseudobacter ginsenosidimutans TaxID=661488 RepID=A0A4Q7N323_9BACT|nr:hypothetical protein [Pseudobacter ginsenosidimutans]QEC43142.1 hypothetical protein FSB84_16105 [Pseudobacter ginsenosidimutans]RZS74498.1 hypothetical protein EV199_0346 [Pseudobacter ginsenosidimutans]
MLFTDIQLKKRGMKCLKPLTFTVFLLTVLLSACNKRELNPGNPAAIQVFNALNDGTRLYTNLSDQRPDYFRLSRQILNKATLRLNVNDPVNSSVTLSWYSIPDTMQKDQPIIMAKEKFENGAIYSMFIYGSKTSAKYTWQKDIIPPLGNADSVTWIRFANFSEDQVISVNLKGEPAGSFVQDLPLYSLSEFVKLSVVKSIQKYEFEITDSNTGTLITTYVIEKLYDPGVFWYNRSNTLVLTGKQGATGTLLPAVTRINYR